jgi:hypothetical protein
LKTRNHFVQPQYTFGQDLTSQFGKQQIFSLLHLVTCRESDGFVQTLSTCAIKSLKPETIGKCIGGRLKSFQLGKEGACGIRRSIGQGIHVAVFGRQFRGATCRTNPSCCWLASYQLCNVLVKSFNPFVLATSNELTPMEPYGVKAPYELVGCWGAYRKVSVRGWLGRVGCEE